MKKLLTVFVAVILLAVCAVSVNAAETGTCGDNLTWTLDGNKLVISGTGPMYDYSAENPAPWSGTSINLWVTIEDGVTSIGAYAFAEVNTTDVWILANIESIGEMAFVYSHNPKLHFFGDAPEFAENTFDKWCRIYIYTIGWDESVKKNYGASRIEWKEEDLFFDVLNSKQLVGLNESVKPEDLVFKVDILGNRRTFYEYFPRRIEISPADNSFYGEKNVTVTVDGHTFDFTYFVTDGTNHLDLITVEFQELAAYNSRKKISYPVVKMGNLLLNQGEYYTLTSHEIIVGIDGQLTITGMGIAEGFEKTFYFPVLKTDISAARLSLTNEYFNGMPHTPRAKPQVPHYNVKEEDYLDLFQNNINVGTANGRAVGLGNCYGEATDTFEITMHESSAFLEGNCIGTVGGELSDDVLLSEGIISPAKLTARTNESEIHIAAYALYKIVGEEAILVDEKLSEVGTWADTRYTYDFSSVYEDDAETGGAVYLLSYSWVTEEEKVYAGAKLLIIPSKVLAATSATLVHVENDGDFRKEYFDLCGDDGTLGQILWESTDPTVAVVENGTATMKKPGVTTIIARCGDLVESYVLTVPQLYLTEGIIFDYSKENGARVIYDSRLLTEGTDYVMSVVEEGKGVTVTVTGKGLFAGELMKTFDGLDSLANPHTHSFDNSCDGTCNGCDFTRSNDHDFAEAWSKNGTQHWHACTACGEKADVEDHTLSAVDNTVCTVCGSLYTPGDLDKNGFVDNKDVEYLLWYTLFAEDYPLNQDADFDGNGQVDNKDVEYLLWHTLFSEDYPLVR